MQIAAHIHDELPTPLLASCLTGMRAFFTGNLALPPGAIDAPNGYTVGAGVPGDIKINRFAGIP